MSRRRALADAERALDEARSWEDWSAAAAEVDEQSGAAAWRAEDESPCYDAGLLRADVAGLRTLREAGDGPALIRSLTASVYRHQVDVAAPELYEVALGGTKHLVGAWLDEAERGLRWIAANPIRGLSAREKLRRFEQAAQVYGQTALMLSGGATWGFHHLGVVKALFAHGVLPHILSGASTGAMVAAGVCARTDAELRAMFDDPATIRLDGLVPLGVRDMVARGAVLDPARLREVLRHNVGEWTFAEAHQRSGRALNISVSPTRTRQKPRVLSHLTAPEVIVANAALASAALPGLFPPVTLEARGEDGRVVPYQPEERWVDGSLYGDLPKLRLARLHNVNQFIVSQTNPHVMPFGRLRARGGVGSFVAGAVLTGARSQGMVYTGLAKQALPAWSGPARQLADRAHALVSQDYGGDIEIHPRFRAELLTKVVANPTPADLDAFIREGERAVWPKLALIRDQTRLGRAFRELVAGLRAEAGGR